ncbi:MAG: FG-GAP-like repeat-containing protein [bacterium]
MTRPLVIALMGLALPGLVLADVGQTDWSSGGGVPGPVAAWDRNFSASQGISWLAVPGQIALSSSAATPTEYLLSDAYVGTAGVDVGDIDNDGDIDIVGTAEVSGTVRLWRNDGGDPLTWTEQVIADPPGASGVDLADLDGDGRLDVVFSLIAPRNKIVWRQNLGGDPIQWDALTIVSFWPHTYEMETGDINGDGHIDVVAAKYEPGEIAWWENSGTVPIVWTQHMVDLDEGGAQSVRCADFDRDGDTDLAAAAATVNRFTVYWNDGANPPGWTAQVLDSTATTALSVWPGDIDGDGDQDVAGIWWENHIAWWRNDGGSPVIWTKQVVCETAYGGHGVCVADMNGDGRLDILGACIEAGKMAWYENGGGSPITWTERILSSTYDGGCTVRAADLDLDGDLEAVGASFGGDLYSWWKATEFDSAGELTSSVLDAGEGEALARLEWTSIQPAGTDLRFQVRGSDDPGDLGAWSGDITAPGCLPGPLARYVQYRAILETTDSAKSPVLKDLALFSCPAGAEPTDRLPLLSHLTARPNPSRQKVTILFTLGAGGTIRLGVFDVTGRSIRDLAHEWMPAGDHQVVWDGLDGQGALPAPGMYWLRLDAPGLKETRVLVLVR